MLEVKGQLAKLLAQEDLIIEHRNVSTAQFDVERRVLTLPMWERASETILDLLISHEVGHALYTLTTGLTKALFLKVSSTSLRTFASRR